MTLPVWVFCIGIDSPQRGSLYVLWTINIFIMCAMIDYTFIMCSLFIYHTVFTQETHENSFRSGYIYRHFIVVFRQCVSSNDGSDDSGLFYLKCLVTSQALIWLLFRVNLDMTWKTILQLEIAVTIFALTWLPCCMQTCIYI